MIDFDLYWGDGWMDVRWKTHCCRREKKPRLGGFKKNKKSMDHWVGHKLIPNIPPNIPRKTCTHGKNTRKDNLLGRLKKERLTLHILLSFKRRVILLNLCL